MKYCYDEECLRLARHFFKEQDPRLEEIAQAIQDTVETFPCEMPTVETGAKHE
jgi:hypothetical protein